MREVARLLVRLAAALGLVSVLTLAAPAIAQDRPFPPQGVHTTGGLRSLAVTWYVVSDDGSRAPITDYVVTIYPIATHVGVDQHSVSGSVRFDNLAPGPYVVHVRAINSYGAGAASPDKQVTVLGPPTSPGIPVGTISGPGEITFHWSPPSWDGGKPVSEYELRINGSLSYHTDGSTTATAAMLVGGTTVLAMVRAHNDLGGWGNWSAQSSTVAHSYPEPPEDIRIKRTGATVAVSWKNEVGESSGGRPIAWYRVVVTQGSANLQKTSTDGSATFGGLDADRDIEVAVVTWTRDADGLTDLHSPVKYALVEPAEAATPAATSSASAPPTETATANPTQTSTPDTTATATPSEPTVSGSTAPGATVAGTTAETSTTTAAPEDESRSSYWVIAVVAIAVLLFLGATWWWYQRRTGSS